MPKRKSAPRTDGFRGYIEYRLTDEDKQGFKKYQADVEALWDDVVKVAEGDYRVTLSWDDYNEAYQCSISQKDDDHVNAGYVLVGRGNSPWGAMAQALFKHLHIMRGDWLNYTKSARNDWD